jgi:hypothetical protein
MHFELEVIEEMDEEEEEEERGCGWGCGVISNKKFSISV